MQWQRLSVSDIIRFGFEGHTHRFRRNSSSAISLGLFRFLLLLRHNGRSLVMASLQRAAFGCRLVHCRQEDAAIDMHLDVGRIEILVANGAVGNIFIFDDRFDTAWLTQWRDWAVGWRDRRLSGGGTHLWSESSKAQPVRLGVAPVCEISDCIVYLHRQIARKNHPKRFAKLLNKNCGDEPSKSMDKNHNDKYSTEIVRIFELH